MKHIPVLLPEVIAAFDPIPGDRYIDATVGEGGHAAALLEKILPTGKLLGLDQDPGQIKLAREKLKQFGQQVELEEARFSELAIVARHHDFQDVNGVLMDLGFSSGQLGQLKIGLSFEDEALLDMRLAPSIRDSAADLLNYANEREIADILFRYGDRHDSLKLARLIMNYRCHHQFRHAKDLKEAIGLASPHAIAPIWQALRIWVNDEYGQIVSGLDQAIGLLRAGGKLAVITFHSGEDRLVKRYFKDHEEFVEIIGSQSPRYQEVLHNSRARSARLRVVIKK